MSAIGTKRTCASALQMSAFGGKADMHRKRPLVTQSGHRPPRLTPSNALVRVGTMPCSGIGGSHETSRFRHASRQCGGDMAARVACAARRTHATSWNFNAIFSYR